MTNYTFFRDAQPPIDLIFVRINDHNDEFMTINNMFELLLWFYRRKVVKREEKKVAKKLRKTNLYVSAYISKNKSVRLFMYFFEPEIC